MIKFVYPIIFVTLSNMTSAAPLSVVLTLFSKGKEGAAEAMFEKVTKITNFRPYKQVTPSLVLAPLIELVTIVCALVWEVVFSKSLQGVWTKNLKKMKPPYLVQNTRE